MNKQVISDVFIAVSSGKTYCEIAEIAMKQYEMDEITMNEYGYEYDEIQLPYETNLMLRAIHVIESDTFIGKDILTRYYEKLRRYNAEGSLKSTTKAELGIIGKDEESCQRAVNYLSTFTNEQFELIGL